MTEIFQIWKCNVCRNIIEVVHKGADSLVCCNKPMVLQEEQLQNSEKGKKHLPIIIENKKVEIGLIEHPMEEEHYIEWIEAVGEKNEHCKIFLNYEEKPKAEFYFKIKQARAYCNLHGLWKN
jgi:superoxide reductase